MNARLPRPIHAEHTKPCGICHPDDLAIFELSCPEYSWAVDQFCPRYQSYDQDTHRLIAKIARGVSP